MTTRLTDEELMLKYQKGDESAFQELYRRYESRVYGYLRKRLENKNWVEDVFQMTFMKLHRSRHQYNPAYRVDQWIFVMTKSVLLDFWKTVEVKNKRYFSQSLEDLSPELHPRTENSIETSPSLPVEFLAGLSSEQQSAIQGRFLDELSYREIAQKLNRSEQSVRQLVSRALRKLRGGKK